MQLVSVNGRHYVLTSIAYCVQLQTHVAAMAEALHAALPKFAAATAATLNSDFGKPQRQLEVSLSHGAALCTMHPC